MITTKDKTTAEVYTEIMQALVLQGQQCSKGDECRYGDVEGNHCAVGWLLPEDNEDLMDNGENLSGLLEVDDLGPNDSFIRENQNDLRLLQNFHDFFKLKFSQYIDKSVNDLGIPEDLINKWLELKR